MDTAGSLTIPDLPPLLRRVPPSPTSEADPALERTRQDWFAWRDGVLAYRREIWRLTGERVWGDTGRPLAPAEPVITAADVAYFREIERIRCERDPLYFVTVWCAVNETRGGFQRRKGWQPAIPYPFQVAFLRWLTDLFETAEDQDSESAVTGVAAKPRTMGVTWSVCLWLLHAWRFRASFTAKLIHRTAAEVDGPNLDTLFSRITSQLGFIKRGAVADDANNPLALPVWLRPARFDPMQHKSNQYLTNPDNGNEVTGAATTITAGRGGRGSFGWIDEFAVIEKPKQVAGSMTETVNMLLLSSTETIEVTTDFLDMVSLMRQSGDPHLHELWWWQHPLYTAGWLDAKRRQYEEKDNLAAFHREILRDAGAGMTAWTYPKSRKLEWVATHFGDFPYLVGSPTVFCIDPGRDDETAINVLCRDLLNPGAWRLFLAYANRGQEPEFYASLIAGIPDERFHYGPVEHAFMETMRRVLYPEIGYGDPYGSNAVTSKADAWYAKMAAWWVAQEAHLPPSQHRRLSVPISCGWKRNQRSLQGRRTSLMRLLDDLYFDHDPQVMETLRAVQSQTWDVADGARSAEQTGARHDHRWTHRTSALEYWAVHIAPTVDLGTNTDFRPYDAA